MPSDIKQSQKIEKISGKDSKIIVITTDIDSLRKDLWNTIHQHPGMNHTHVAMALGLVQYELIHHIGAKI